MPQRILTRKMEKPLGSATGAFPWNLLPPSTSEETAMRFVLMSMIVVGTMAASEAQAQRQPGGPITAPRGGGMIYFFTDDNKALQEELKLTGEQIDKLKDALKSIHERRREMMQGFNPSETTDEQMQEMQKTTVKLIDEAKKAAEDILK